MSEVTELIDSYKAGELTLDALAQRFRDRQWPVVKPPEPSSYLEMAARAQDDGRRGYLSPAPSTTSKTAYWQGDLSREEYDRLAEAVRQARDAGGQ